MEICKELRTPYDIYSYDFDSDELGIHVPQTIQTVEELRLIAKVAEHFIPHSTTRIVINAKQDTNRIDWKDCMNI